LPTFPQVVSGGVVGAWLGGKGAGRKNVVFAVCDDKIIFYFSCGELAKPPRKNTLPPKCGSFFILFDYY
jgi:hypothetical protein